MNADFLPNRKNEHFQDQKVLYSYQCYLKDLKI
jgi:hypothetical protein